ncbi:MAG TPA: 1-deoxy-D-xylulose-5-phosphate reductoisomerase [Candidatus Nanoarchaeia archaeon]|nr:1-deoxy-D-xylulose-5-phosphate reductoisomerase [Candidatus Nanoarchaeia archaeon]
MKKIAILGSTGSIGRQALEVIGNNPDRFRAIALTCNSNVELIKEQIRKFSPEAVAVMDSEKADELSGCGIDVHSGLDGINKIAALEDADIIVNALVGSIGIMPTCSAIKAGKNIALANKETLVSAGKQIMEMAGRKGIRLFPVDSEHSGIFQCPRGIKQNIKKIILTCSGGPFRDFSEGQLKNVTREQALNHPTWKMGDKITIDSATLMNKGFEVIEAHWLYGIEYDDIDVVIHPQSVVHSVVEFSDGSMVAQMGVPDMRIPIQYALSYPERLNHSTSLDLTRTNLEFRNPSPLFPCLQLAYNAGRVGGSLPAVMNAANEVAVRNFLAGKIKFGEIYEAVKKEMDSHNLIKDPSIEEIMEIDRKIKGK